MLWKETWGAGETKTFSGSFDFFRLLRTPGGAVDVTLFRNGSTVSINEGVEGGFWEKFPRNTPCDGVQIKSSVAQVIQFATRVQSEVGFDIQSLTFPASTGAFTQTKPTIAAASGVLSAANANRKYFAVQNTSANIVYLNLQGAAATVAAGVQIPPGGYYVLDRFLPSNAINAIAAVASDVILIEA